MSYVVIDNFNLGLDDRRSLLTAKPGTLSRLENAHITRGGEIERRKEFSLLYSYTYGKGLQATDSGLYQFGSEDLNTSKTVSGLDFKYPRYPNKKSELYQNGVVTVGLEPQTLLDYNAGATITTITTIGSLGSGIGSSGDWGKTTGSGTCVQTGTYPEVNGAIGYDFDAATYGPISTSFPGNVSRNCRDIWCVFRVSTHVNNSELLLFGGEGQLKMGTTSGQFVYDLNGFSCSVTGLSMNKWYLYHQKVEVGGSSTATITFYELDNTSSTTITATATDSDTQASNTANADTTCAVNDGSSNGLEVAELYVYDSIADAPSESNMLSYFQAQYLAPTYTPPIYYQRLQHPDGSTAMSSVEFSTVFNGKAFVVAKFADDSYQAFYNGAIIPDFYAGKVRSDHADIGEMLDEIASEISAISGYSAAVAGDDTLNIERTDGTDFTVSVTPTDGGGTGDEEIEITTEVDATPQVDEVPSQGRLLIQNGAASATITAVTVGGVSILSGSPVAWTTDDINTAKLLAAAINSSTPATGTVARIEMGSPYTGATNAVIPAGGEFYVSAPTVGIVDGGGTGSGAAATANMVAYKATGYDATGAKGYHTFYRVDSISITNPGSGYSGPLTITFTGGTNTVPASASSAFWGTKEAKAVGYVENGSGKPVNYTAKASGAYVIISGADGLGDAPDGETIAATTTGTISVTQKEAMGGYQAGAFPIQGSNKRVNCEFSGTLEAGDTYRVTLTDSNGTQVIAGGARVLGVTPVTAKSFKQKLYLAAGGNLYYSALDDATEWESDSDGSGVINMQTEFSDYSGIKAVTTYQNNLAVFSRRSGQIWFVDPDDSLNQQIQILENVGALSPGSAVTMGDSDVLFVSDFGVRSLRVRDSSNAAFVSDVGTPIDATIISEISSMSASEIDAVTSGVEPKDGRYFAYINGKIYVLSFFPGSKISAWSTYTLNYGSIGATIAPVRKFEPYDGEMYILGGVSGQSYDNIHIVGKDETIPNEGNSYATGSNYGAGYTTYVETPYLDAGRPGDLKRWTGIDMSATGDWLVYMNCDPQTPDTWELIARDVGNTAGLNKLAFDAHGTHIRFRFTETAITQSKISNLIVHFEQLNEE